MLSFDNIKTVLIDDLKAAIKKDSKVYVVANCFSMYAYRALKEQLDKVKEFKFIFSSPTFIAEKAEKQKKEFYIPRLNREHSLYGTEYEIKLRNELTQRAIAQECADWISSKAQFKSNTTGEFMGGFMSISSKTEQAAYNPLLGFTTADFGCEKGNNAYTIINKFDSQDAERYIQIFDHLWEDKIKYQDVTKEIIENIRNVYNENSPEFIYAMALYHVFSEFLEDISEDTLPNEATGFKQSSIWNMLYDFQRDAVLAIINKLEKYNGCILADSVGLGKTFTALAVAKYYENRNKTVLVLCPKKLAENWNTYKDNYVNNPIASDRLNYDVLFHTDLSRSGGVSNGLDLDRLNWGNYDLVIIDESHNFRNGIGTHARTQESRYLNLLQRVIRPGVKTKVLMLSATPVNNRFLDLKNQLALAYEGNPRLINDKLRTSTPIDTIFKKAQQAFNKWSKYKQNARTTESLLNLLDLDFFEVLDSVTIARSRKHIESYYNTDAVGKFPSRLDPISKSPHLTDLDKIINYNEIYKNLMLLNLNVYTPSKYIFPSKLYKYVDSEESLNLTRSGREQGVRRLMAINLLKRLESSVHSFLLSLSRIKELIDSTIDSIDDFEENGSSKIRAFDVSEDDFDIEDGNDDLLNVGQKLNIDLEDMDYKSWRKELKEDSLVLKDLVKMVSQISPEHDSKLQELFNLIDNKIAHPINGDNKKLLIFSAFSDTAEYLYEHISKYVKAKYGLDSAIVTGSIEGRTTVKGVKPTLNNVLTLFSPLSKNKSVLLPNSNAEVDVLIATDCISEGQNLQDCDYCVNYDIHWNPMRIIQRFGRIDRIGSQNEVIQLVNFWPDITLDEYINLKSRVEDRMKITVLSSTGDDDPINSDEDGDLAYRKEQLERLKHEIPDIEDMNTGISIMDLGLNEFRLDLLGYLKTHESIENKPKGLHAVVPATDKLAEGAIFVLKNVNDSVNIDNQNRIHPFYMVYIGTDGKVLCDYLNPKRLLDDIRLLCKGKSEPVKKLCAQFNKETDDGRNMAEMSELLSMAIDSIINTKTESDIDSLFGSGGTSALLSDIKGLQDFELICFLVVKDGDK